MKWLLVVMHWYVDYSVRGNHLYASRPLELLRFYLNANVILYLGVTQWVII